MTESNEKVRSLEDYKKSESDQKYDQMTQELRSTTTRDMGKMGLFVAALAFILVVVLFFGLNQNLSGLTKEVKDLAAMKTQVAAMDTRVTGVEGKVTELEKLPSTIRKMMAMDALQDVTRRLNKVGADLESPEQAAKVAQAMNLLQQVLTESGQ